MICIFRLSSAPQAPCEGVLTPSRIIIYTGRPAGTSRVNWSGHGGMEHVMAGTARSRVCVLALIVVLTACNSGGSRSMRPSTRDDTRPYLLETVGEFAVSRVYADGFEDLSKNERALAFYLYRAALGGRDIFYDQMGRDVLEIRDLLEEILIHPKGID